MKTPTIAAKDLHHLIPRIIVIIIIGQTLPFKFLGDEESIYIFSKLNMEPYGRYAIAIIETIAIFLLASKLYVVGAIISLSIISAANFLHFVKLGLVVREDGGLLFILSIIVVLASAYIVFWWNQQKKAPKKFNFGTGAD